MTRKVDLSKQAWEWIDKVTEPGPTELATAYRVDCPPCEAGCRRNCKGNPNCLRGLGEQFWFSEIDESKWTDLDDPLEERRKEGLFVGLKNLGATCYVNSLLQVWFSNPEFRKAMYLYRPQCEAPQLPIVNTNSASDDDLAKSYYPNSPIAQLQLVFVLLQCSNRRYVDPSNFIKSLGLNAAEQQDAQEFSKLFMALLEDRLKDQADSRVSGIVHNQFQGRYSYVTTCTKCSKESTLSSEFYELDLSIKGHKELGQCIDEFLQEEKLEGANQYFCSSCQSHQNACRKIRLNQLPPVLNLQLLRFVYDRQAGQKKKLNSHLRFPEVLDMNKFFDSEGSTSVKQQQSNGNKCIYDLTAVLVHRGSTAFSGHYVALIRDRATGQWVKFNDEEVEKIEEKDLKSGLDEDEEEPSKKSKPGRTPKGVHSSPNAYMLVYHRQDDKAEVVPPAEALEIPEKLKEIVAIDDAIFQSWLTEMSATRATNIDVGKARQLEIHGIYPNLNVSEGQPWEWLSTEWLMQWMKEDGNVPPISAPSTTCPHQRVHPDDVPKLKRVRQDEVSKLFAKYKGSPRLGMDTICRECVVRRATFLRMKARIAIDSKFITNTCRAKLLDGTPAYWVGKSSLKCWRTIALSPYVESSDDNEMTDDVPHSNGATNSVGKDCSSNSNQEDGESVEVSSFNDEILCEHGNLDPNETKRRLVPETVWERLKLYFMKSPQFDRDVLICNVCHNAEAKLRQLKDFHRVFAKEQKDFLPELYLDRNRPTLCCSKPGKFFLIGESFLATWRKFVKDPTRYEPITNIDNVSLLCPHLKLPFAIDENMDMDKLGLVTEEEWSMLGKFFKVDHPISLTVAMTSGAEEEKMKVVTEPEICIPCNNNRLKEKKNSLLTYTNVAICVIQLPTEESALPAIAEEKLEIVEGDYESSTVSKKRKITKRSLSRRGRHCSESAAVTVSTSSLATSATDATAVRRSSRHRRGPNEKTFVVSSSTTLRELKLKMLKVFEAAPFDQHIFLNGKELCGSDATLGELEITPHCQLFLRVDEPSDSVSDEGNAPEEGFKGTELMRK